MKRFDAEYFMRAYEAARVEAFRQIMAERGRAEELRLRAEAVESMRRFSGRAARRSRAHARWQRIRRWLGLH